MALQAEEKEKETLEREARIALLRERNATEKEKDGGEYRLVASFSDEGRLYSANTTEEKYNVSEMKFEGLEMWKCLLWAIVSTFALWVLECFLFPILTKTIGKRTTENGSNN